ncbi:hypothetical protein D3C72_1786850 [compost metagenome]
MQLGHAIGLRALKAHHGHHVLLHLARSKGGEQSLLRIEHARRRFDDVAVFGHGRHLDHRATQAPLQQAQTAGGRERPGHGAQHGFVARHRRGALPACGNAAGVHAHHIGVHEAAGQQLAQDPRGATCGLELVHVGIAIGVHAGQQRHGG